MTEQFYNLISLPQTGSLKKEVVNYDEQTLKDALNYLTTRDTKPTLQRWIRTELATRERTRGNTRYSKGFASTSWAIKWGKEWDEARMVLRRKYEANTSDYDHGGHVTADTGKCPNVY